MFAQILPINDLCLGRSLRLQQDCAERMTYGIVPVIRLGVRERILQATLTMAERSPNPSQELDDDEWKEQEGIRAVRNAIWEAGDRIRKRVRQEPDCRKPHRSRYGGSGALPPTSPPTTRPGQL